MSRRAFAVDAMYGGVARKLRMLGFDSTYDPDADDDAILRDAGAGGRVLITADADLLRRARKAGVVAVRPEGADQAEQILHIADALGLGMPRADGGKSRCAACNGVLRGEDSAGVRRCSSCGKAYWHGSHLDNLQRSLEKACGGRRWPAGARP